MIPYALDHKLSQLIRMFVMCSAYMGVLKVLDTLTHEHNTQEITVMQQLMTELQHLEMIHQSDFLKVCIVGNTKLDYLVICMC
jgi:hypothetical protein